MAFILPLRMRAALLGGTSRRKGIQAKEIRFAHDREAEPDRLSLLEGDTNVHTKNHIHGHKNVHKEQEAKQAKRKKKRTPIMS